MTSKKMIFETNPQKANAKIMINSFMMGSLFFILTLIWSKNPTDYSLFIASQIVFAVPLLYVSSLAYSKIGHWDKTRIWDALGWFCNNSGNIMILNVVGLMAKNISIIISGTYFILVIFLMVVYSAINIYYKSASLKEKIFKFMFFLIILTLGGILPLIS